MNDQDQIFTGELLKIKPDKINKVDTNLQVIKTIVKKFSDNNFTKKTSASKNESSLYDELHYGNYE